MGKFEVVTEITRFIPTGFGKKLSKFMSFKGERYSVTVVYCTYQSEQAPDMVTYDLNVYPRTPEFPDIFVASEDQGERYVPTGLSIDTSSKGSLPVVEYEKLLGIMRQAVEDAKAIQEEFIEPILNGSFCPQPTKY